MSGGPIAASMRQDTTTGLQALLDEAFTAPRQGICEIPATCGLSPLAEAASEMPKVDAMVVEKAQGVAEPRVQHPSLQFPKEQSPVQFRVPAVYQSQATLGWWSGKPAPATKPPIQISYEREADNL